MVLLKPTRLAWLAVPWALASACSVVLDPDQIDAERLGTHATDATTSDDTADATAPTDASDSTPPADTSPADTAPPGDTGLALDVRYQGSAGCVLDYKITPITSCPETCPAGGWSLAFDASGTPGTHTFDWHFSATDNYRVGSRNASGARVTVKVDVPSCELLAGAAVGPAKVLAELSVDGDAYRIVATLDFSVRQITTCGGSGDCPTP